MHVASSPARLAKRSLPVSNLPAFLRPASTHSRRASPESMAEATKMGAMMAEYQPSRESCSPKIQAVTECTRMATGRAKRLTMATLRSAPSFLEFMNTRYRTLIAR